MIAGAARRGVCIPLLVAGLACCQSEPPRNSVWRAAAERQVEELRGDRGRLERERWRLQRGLEEDQAATAELRNRAAAAASELGEQMRRLAAELHSLQTVEEDLAQARHRAREAEAALQPLRVLEAAVAERERRLAEVRAARDTVERDLAAAEADLAAAQQRALARLREVQQQREAVERLHAAAVQALRAIGAALQPLLPKQTPDPGPGQAAAPPGGKSG
jgi:chromosome segregation ATPase